ncbi:hypothetical protein PUN28_003526 [Cardiocondyla obscurior]|uniref:Uncharacterized protein n=1 Tax=Cardiocondyla obscurior TaxID=286306 RepID=A0AAW2GMZ1_9HYME
MVPHKACGLHFASFGVPNERRTRGEREHFDTLTTKCIYRPYPHFNLRTQD